MPGKQNWWKSEVMVFQQSFWGIVTNTSKMRCQRFGCKRNWSLLGFGLAQLGGLAFFAWVEKLLNKWSHGFWAILVGNCHKCIQNEVWEVWLQKELILVGFWISKLGGLAFCALVAKFVKKWSHGLWAIFVGMCHKCMQNEVWKFLAAKWIDLGWVLAYPSLVACASFVSW